jgi:integrase
MAKTKPNSKKRKIRSDKFPLTLHPTGQYCKKIKGKLHYFGNDKQKALQNYLEQATILHAGRGNKCATPVENMTLKTLRNLYLEHQESKVQTGELTAAYFSDQVKSLRKFVRFIGSNSTVAEISTLDLQNYKRKLRKSYGSAHRVNLNIAIMKAVFHWARKNDVVQTIPNIDAVAKAKTINGEKPIFTYEQIHKLLKMANCQMRAMIWLGLNCGFGCTDCAELQWKDLDTENKRVNLHRKKTGIKRNLLLWPETIKALEEISKSGRYVFLTSQGNPWVRTIQSVDKNGNIKYTKDNALSKKFSKLLKKAGIKTEKGVGFYTLRRTAATLAAKSGDPFAVQRLLGHADLKMATTYVQDVSEQTDRVINNSRKLIIQDDS